MTDLSAIWANLAPQVTGLLGGETILLARPSSLASLDPDGAVGAMELHADAAEGATALVLALPGGGRMTGTLLAGARLVISGETYTLTADATAPPGGLTLAVAIAPDLFAPVFATHPEDPGPPPLPAVEATQVQVLGEALFAFRDCQVSYRKRSDAVRHLQESYRATVTIPSKGAPTQPRLNDMVTLPDGTVGRVAGGDVGDGAFWKLIVGA